ncbi:unnamed protein product [Brassicogethes aeneus]|uniref:Ubiquitin conjugation factor E4 A n=1 Tax=Brassicogethes aeneus TaxID=1431903 RepID=A0A9P0AQ10_BRAAE|nr:unnamed protein product [Brassicogethes aeneus]
MSSQNPFLALIAAKTDSNESFEENSPENSKTIENTGKVKSECLSDIIEEIFRFTVNEKNAVTKDRLYLEEVRRNCVNDEMDLGILNQALFDRLFMCNSDNDYLTIYASKYPKSPLFERQVLFYLYKSFRRLKKSGKLKDEDHAAIEDIIFMNVATAIMQPDIYCGQNLAQQMLKILNDAEDFYEQFFLSSCKRVIEEEESYESVKRFNKEMYNLLRDDIQKYSLMAFNYNVFELLRVMTSEEYLAEYFIEFNEPARTNVGSDYANTVLGALFNCSALPKIPSGVYEHFTEPMNQVANSNTEGFLWNNMKNLTQHIHSFFLTLLKKSPTTKDTILRWLGDCLKNNAYRGKIWNAHAPPEMNPANYTTVTDGYMVNFCSVMLRLCEPFSANFRDKKILKVDPTYCAVPEEKLKETGIHMSDLSKETCVLPVENTDGVDEQRPHSKSFNFVTECFFMAHRAMDLGFRVGVDKLIKMNHEMGRLERTLNDAMAGGGNDAMQDMRERMNKEISKYFCLKCQLSDPVLLTAMFDLISSTCYWLSQIVVHEKNADGTYAPLTEAEINFPIGEEIPITLKCIPEFILENVVSFLTFLRRFNPKVLEEHGFEKMEPILTCILMYMGSQNLVKNPHLRARFAEGLESLLPYHKDDPPGFSNMGSFQREKLFSEHRHSLQITTSILEVFVGIEMTGQSVEFEQKFNYRRPMYAIINYLWKLPQQMECFRDLADYAENNMEAVNPPLFLRFANLLINDAIFLLDEALSNMAKIKDMQHARESGQWDALPSRERAQQHGYLQHVGMLARFDNILGRDTIQTLVKLTSKIQKVFTHTTMVDRIAAMLNYFLLSLVGPNKQNFKVSNPQEYSFDPAATVMDICKIYVNLKDNKAFVLAISQDGRSYSPQLFTFAEDVLVRIGGGNLLAEIKEIADLVEIKAKEYKANEEALAEAPEHFLDPIMSTLMADPVILPSSKQTVDRTTIARHLLSDQTDPFNRSPLSMDQVIPNVELAKEIQQWLSERRC